MSANRIKVPQRDRYAETQRFFTADERAERSLHDAPCCCCRAGRAATLLLAPARVVAALHTVRPASHRYSAGVQNPHLFARYATLLDGPSPATLTTYRRDGSAVGSPVWFRRHGETVEVVIAADDVKLRHLARHPQCAVLIFEAVPPFRGIRVEGKPVLTHGDVTRFAWRSRRDTSG